MAAIPAVDYSDSCDGHLLIWLDVWHRTDFENAVSEQEALWIKDGGPDDKAWEKYLKTLDHCGMNELLEVYQAAYDRYAAAQ